MKKRIADKHRRRKKSLSPEERELKELGIMQHNLTNARKVRDALAEALESEPNIEGYEHLIRLETAVNREQYEFGARIAEKLRRDFVLLAANLHATVDECPDETLLRDGDEALPAKNLQRFIELRDGTAPTLKIVPPEEKPDEILRDFDRVIEEVRRKIEAKRARAQKTLAAAAAAKRRRDETQAIYKRVFPDHTDLRAQLDEDDNRIPLTPLTADGSEYEMPEDHKEAVRQREAAIKMRDYCRAQIEKTKHEKQGDKDFAAFVENVDALDEWITNSEKVLKAEKESHQATMRSRAKLEAAVNDYENALQDEIARNPHILLGGTPKPKGQ